MDLSTTGRDRLAFSYTYLNDFVEVGILPCGVLVLAEYIMYGLCTLQVVNFILLKIQRSVIRAGERLYVGQPKGTGIRSLAEQVEGEGDVPHCL